MSRVQIFISSIIMLIVIATSVLQYHHHDRYGQLCMYNTTEECIDYCESHENETLCTHSLDCHCSHHSTRDAGHEDESKCSLKLSNVSYTKQFSLKEHSITFIVLHEIIASYINKPIIYDEYITIDSSCPPLPTIYITPCGLRAPPIV